jgi:Phage integrase, N-terminal SAM-like domain
MRGHIRERSPGRWAIVIDAHVNGERKRRWRSFVGTKRQAQIECARLISEMQSGTSVEPNRVTLTQLLDQWLQHVKQQVSARTHERYGEIVRVYLAPALGSVLVTKLHAMAISAAYADMLSNDRRRGGGGLSPRSVHHCHRILSQALRAAVRWRVLSRNPCDDVDPPRVEPRMLKVWDVATMAQALERCALAAHLHADASRRDAWASARRDRRVTLAPR